MSVACVVVNSARCGVGNSCPCSCQLPRVPASASLGGAALPRKLCPGRVAMTRHCISFAPHECHSGAGAYRGSIPLFLFSSERG